MSNYLADVIKNLRFFTVDGHQIQMQKEYNVSWEVVPCDEVYGAFIKTPKGHFMRKPVNLYVDAFNESYQDVKTGQIYVSKDNRYVLETDDMDDYILSKRIQLQNNTVYTATLDMHTAYPAVLVCNEHGDIIGHLPGKSTYSALHEYEFTLSELRKTWRYADSIRLQTRMTGEYALFSNSTSLEVIVDEPGLVNPNVDFYRKQSVDEEYLFDFRKLSSDGNVSKQTQDPFTKLRKNSGLLHQFSGTDYADVILFCYKYVFNGKTSYIYNRLKVTVQSGDQTETVEYPVIDILRTDETHASENFVSSTELTVSTDDALCEEQTQVTCYSVHSGFFTQTLIGDMLDISNDDTFTEYEMTEMTSAYYVMSNNVEENEFPYVHLQGSILQEPVSTGFVQTDTVIVLDEKTNEHGQKYYEYPELYIEDEESRQDYRLVFRVKSQSEVKFISSDSKAVMTEMMDAFMPLRSSRPELNEVTDPDAAMYMTIGFQTQEEGCYQNPIGMFLRNITTGDEHFIGVLVVKSEAIGEDERFRTLMTNFGIPDPITYPEVFRQQQPEEQGQDFKLINEKSKELFIYYDKIFPYTGTYKALMNAVKYLGYQDLVFKEWFRLKDTNDNNRYVAVQTYDMETGTAIENMLKKYGVSFGDYERYTKLNRLSMVYHMQEMTSGHEEPLRLKNGQMSTYYDVESIPQLKNVYEYRTDEILAKLYSVKKWLENYITGVNCYISDINGEGIVLERVKTIGYVTENHFKDIQNIGFFTPNARQTTDFQDSSTVVECSLNEFTNVTVEDYADYPIDTFIKETMEVTTGQDKKTVYISAPMGAMTVADEYQFTLHLNNADSGSLYEFSGKSDNTVIISDGEIKLWNNFGNAVFDKDSLPVISIKKGNLRRIDGSWKNNVMFTIKQSKDPATGNTYYAITDLTKEERPVIRTKGSVMLSPVESTASLEYSPENKWRLPLFFMKGYRITNQMKQDKYSDEYPVSASEFLDMDREYVLEIIDGEINFRNNGKQSGSKECDTAGIMFSEPYNDERQKEQQISINYTWSSERQPVYTFNRSSFMMNPGTDVRSFMDSLENNTLLNTKLEIPVNRTGGYSVSVKAYDAYNNIFTSKDDDICWIRAKKPGIDIIVNSTWSNNEPDFHIQNIAGSLLSDDEKQEVVSSCDMLQRYPVCWPVYNPERVSEDNRISYDVISYAIDTPKENDYLLLSNLTECVFSIEDEKTMTMCSHNTGKQSLYIKDGLVDFILINTETNRIIHEETSSYRIASFEKPSGKVSSHKQPDGKLVLEDKIP